MRPRPARRKIAVRETENFAKNLQEIEAFLGTAGAEEFQNLLASVLEVVIPNLERFPRIGIDFLTRQPALAKALSLHRRLRRIRTMQIREYMMDDYLLLYAYSPAERLIHLLALRHHRQLTFDLAGAWLQ